MTLAQRRNDQPTKTEVTEQYALNYSFDSTFMLLVVGMLAYNPATETMDRVQIGSDGGIKTAGAAYATKITSSSGDTYVGEATPGTSYGDALWRIQKIDGSGNVTWKDGTADFVNTATDLTTGSFS